MSMKRFTLTAFVILLVLSFVVTTAGADSDQQQPPAPAASTLTDPDLSESSQVPERYVPEGEMGIDVAAPTPLSPSNNQWTFNRLPKFYFTKNLAATAYMISVVSNTREGGTTQVYAYTGPFTCGSSYCWMQPTKKLPTWKYSKDGDYSWTVEAMVGGEWQGPDIYGRFYVFSSGFTSTFTSNSNLWTVINGSWSLTSKGYYKTSGTLGKNVNIRQDEYYDDGYVYEVRYRRKLESGTPVRFFLNGHVKPMTSNDYWDNGFALVIYNEGNWRIANIILGAESDLASGETLWYEPFGWNTVKLWIHDHNLYLWINGVFITSVSASDYVGGYVGVGMYEGDPDVSPLLIDYAKVYYSAVWPDNTPMPKLMGPGSDVQ